MAARYGWFPWQQDGESISLSPEGIYKVQIMLRSLHEAKFTLPFSDKKAKYP